MMKVVIGFFCAFMMLVLPVHAQYFQFSQYNFTKQRINPATVGLSDYASASFDYRRQSTGAGFNLNSSFVDLSYPLFTRKKVRWSGIGLSFMDDRSGASSMFRTKEVALSYAGNIHIAKGQTLSIGTKFLYQIRKLDTDALYTGQQYVEDRGFDRNVFNGEPIGILQTDHFSINMGLHWQLVDDKGNSRAYIGTSFFDFNKPQEDFIVESSLNSTWVSAAGVRVFKKEDVSVMPEILYTQSGKTSLINVGFVTQYDLEQKGKFRDHLKILTKYVQGRSAIGGLQLHKENFSIGFSYDFPVTKNDAANQGAFEIGLELRRLIVRSKDPFNRKSQVTPRRPVTKKTQPDTTNVEPIKPTNPPPPERNEMSERLKHKQDSVDALAHAGLIKHEALILETAVVHFNFDFNSAEPDEAAMQYMDNLAEALLDNPKLRITITGHTDNVGSDKFNLKLSIYRAQAIKSYLIRQGILDERILADGKGMREPLNKNRTPEERALNRRVELKIIYD